MGEPALSGFEWTGNGSHCIILRVSAAASQGRTDGYDESPAWVHLNFAELFGFSNPTDLDTMQVIRHDVDGAPVPYGKYGAGLGPCDLPFRFDFDDADPRTFRHMHNVLGRSCSGDLVWTHVQEGNRPSFYAVYFDEAKDLPTRKRPRKPSLGDCDVLYQAADAPLGRAIHTTPLFVDWDRDGRPDLVLATGDGYISNFRNVGVRASPRFGTGEFSQADGKAIFLEFGRHYKPVAVDWDGDGDLDLIAGSEAGGTACFFENEAGPAEPPRFRNRGRLRDRHGEELATPTRPCPELPFFEKPPYTDYTPVPEVVDWNGDGEPDLLLGGYATGLIFHYANVGRNPDGTPMLEYAGSLEADGRVIDVGWIASPTVADFRGSGMSDLVSGSMRVLPHGGFASDERPSLHYYKNVGTKMRPRLTEIPFPLEGDRWAELAGIVYPRAYDWNGDGKTDLVLGVGGKVVLLENIGRDGQALFRIADTLKATWTNYLFGSCTGVCQLGRQSDVSLLSCGDGPKVVRLVRGLSSKNPRQFAPDDAEVLAAEGHPIEHGSATGDPFTVGRLVDWTGKGRLDLVVGNADGRVWLYENAATNRQPVFRAGRKLRLASGSDLVVGRDETKDGWETHVGCRAMVAAGDMNNDGLMYLVIGDAQGNVTYFRNVGTHEEPAFAEGERLFQEEPRAFVDVADWNSDGLLDIVVSWTGADGMIRIYLNEGSREQPRFNRPIIVRTPFWVPYASPFVCDWDADGNADLMLACSYGLIYFLDRSFIERGYVKAAVIGVRRR